MMRSGCTTSRVLATNGLVTVVIVVNEVPYCSVAVVPDSEYRMLYQVFGVTGVVELSTTVPREAVSL